MRRTFTFLFVLFFTASAMHAQDLISIADARSQDGATVKIQGIMGVDYGFNNGQFYVQDNTAGINVFYQFTGGEAGSSVDYDQGDLIEIVGTIGSFSEQIQISPSSVTIISEGDDIPEPQALTPADIMVPSPFEGMYVELVNVSLVNSAEWPVDPIDSGSGISLDATAGPDAVPFEIRIDRGQSFYDGSTAPTGPFTLKGYLGRFNDVFQILPFYDGDIEEGITNTFEVANSNTLKIYPNPVTDNITLDVMPQAGLVQQAALYDVMGRKVTDFGNLNAQNQTISLELPTNISNGAYYLTVQSENKVFSQKLNILR